MTAPVTLLREGSLAILRIDNPPVNSLSPVLIAELVAALDAFEADRTFEGLVVTCAGRTFVAGGDITSFDDPAFTARPFNGFLARLEALDRPVVAALFGTALGGGLELALACHHRVADASTRVGLPEITLGIVPGSLGTQRLPRLAGYATAYRLISTGRPIGAAEALSLGIVDEVVDGDVEAAARAAAMRLIGQPPRRASTLTPPDAADAVLAEARKAAADRPYLPVLSSIATCLDAVARPFAEGAAVEETEFLKLMASAPSRAQRHIFLAERAAARIPGLAADLQTRAVRTVGILGVGTMGGGIAMTFANAGFDVKLVETSQTALDRGVGLIDAAYAATVKRGKLSEADAAARRARMSGGIDFSALADVDLVVEAVFEDMDLKLSVAKRLGETCKPGAIIATNTSTLDVDKIAAATGRPADVVGTHFFSPAHIMRLLEVVRGRETAPDVLATVMALAKKIGKTAVVSGVCYGFIGNRMAEVYMRESEAMQLEGASPQAIDHVAESPDWIGMAMGPARMLDMAGVDVGARTVIEWIKSGEGPRDPAYRILCRTMFADGAHGQKAGHGYYRYEGRNALPDADNAALSERLAHEHGISRRAAIPDSEIFERLLFPMVNEAALILAEGIAYRPGDIDVVWTAGYGFPAWRGGPLCMADEIGIGHIVARLDHYAATFGNEHGYWTVAPLLRKLAESGTRLTDWRA
jgi:3-hydroxyacyl-CoA dehydrogenase